MPSEGERLPESRRLHEPIGQGCDNTRVGVTVPTLNEQFAARLDKLGLRIPELLLPSPGTDLRTWAVIACDQYTSDRAYWNAVRNEVGNAPSTLHLVLPEIHLGDPDEPERVASIHSEMQRYLGSNQLASVGECLVYVRRSTERSGLREGFVVAVDLERYDYSRDSKSLIRATEGTIVDRIPPRLAVRQDAPLELPHIMVLVQDADYNVIESWGARRGDLEKLYDLELMQNGGHLEGYRVDRAADVDEILTGFEALLDRTRTEQSTDQPLFWAMGDGNHSLATAKANWEKVKHSLPASSKHGGGIPEHPARWALVEIVNVHSTGLRFEPIHRAVFTSQRAALTECLRSDPALARIEAMPESTVKALLSGPDGQYRSGYFDGETFYAITWLADRGLPPALVDDCFGRFTQTDPSARIDFIHGWEDTLKLATSRAAGFFLPVLARERLFGYVEEHGPLARKSFSMGDAEEKRYYMEARRITT